MQIQCLLRGFQTISLSNVEISEVSNLNPELDLQEEPSEHLNIE